MHKTLKSKRGEGYIDICVFILCSMFVIALAVKVLPVYMTGQKLNVFAAELVREAELSGRVGTETSRREQSLREQTGLVPEVRWSATGRIQLNQEVSVSLTYQTNIGLFGDFANFPITLRAGAIGKGEVYWK